MLKTETIVNEFLLQLKNRNLHQLTNLFKNEVKWEIPGNVKEIKWLGRRKTRDEVKEFFELLWASSNAVAAEIHRVIIHDADVIIKGSFTSEMLLTKKSVTSLFFIHMVIIAGQIAEYTLLEDSFAVSESMKN